jgi:hypothetical protein
MNMNKCHDPLSVLGGSRAGGGSSRKLDECDVGISDTLADEVLRTISTGAAVAGKGGSSDIGDAVKDVRTFEQAMHLKVCEELTRR